MQTQNKKEQQQIDDGEEKLTNKLLIFQCNFCNQIVYSSKQLVKIYFNKEFDEKLIQFSNLSEFLVVNENNFVGSKESFDYANFVYEDPGILSPVLQDSVESQNLNEQQKQIKQTQNQQIGLNQEQIKMINNKQFTNKQGQLIDLEQSYLDMKVFLNQFVDSLINFEQRIEKSEQCVNNLNSVVRRVVQQMNFDNKNQEIQNKNQNQHE
ncbi:hypothetical protein PPERSA_04542 [Pseudocohnilembus persalinus]|uniref:Uncharacterized protein n=1 Tax=Pseudocohnilembus persalinus TaxID=266149 RepID=A0A0V0QTH7_PSEPJ|nr:hypothetical protein PPERSA_04542 [Pseudocohnilembus persalinus]|eukprot:KRX05505.1 hypothetical protein PPERSA_04542 [Pseudocohnilembus persalinus]